MMALIRRQPAVSRSWLNLSQAGLHAVAMRARRLFGHYDDSGLDAHLARIVHDLKQPLATLVVSLDMLAMTTPPSEHVQRCQRAVRRQRALIDDLLTLTSKLELAEPIDVKALLREVVDDLQPAAARRSVELTVDVQAEATLSGNRLSLGRAFSNVVMNAIEMTTESSRVEVVLVRKRDLARIDVHDQGPGLARELRERVFEPFFTLRHGGTGLGLAIARAAAKAHHGTVRFVDATGGCVRFELPCTPQRRMTTAAAASVAPARVARTA